MMNTLLIVLNYYYFIKMEENEMGNYEKIANIIGVDFEEQFGISGVANKTFYLDKVKGLLSKPL